MNGDDYRPSANDLTGSARPAEAPEDFRLPEGVLLALRPFGHHMVTEGVPKPFDAVEVYAIAVGEDGDYEDLGMRDCAWQFVMRELDKCTPDTPWCIGTVKKKSRAYFLVPPYPEEEKAGLASIAALVADREREEAQWPEGDDGSEEPF